MAGTSKRTLALIWLALAQFGCTSKKPYLLNWEKIRLDGLGSFGGAALRDTLQGSNPVIDGETLYVATRGGAVLALTLKNAQPIWRTPLGEAVEAPAALDNERLFIADLNGYLHGLNRKTGKVEWTFQVGSEVLSQPAIVGDNVVVATTQNQLLAVKRADGAFAWRAKQELPKGVTIRGVSAPSHLQGASGERIFVGLSNGLLIAVDGKSGEVVWQQNVAQLAGSNNDSRKQSSKDVDAAPLLIEEDGKLAQVIAPSVAGPLAAYSPTGRLLWLVDSIRSHSGAIVDGNVVYAGNQTGEVFAIDRKTGQILWKNENTSDSEGVVSSLILDGDYLIAGLSDGNVRVIEKTAQAGTTVWNYRVDQRLSGSLVKGPNGFLALTGKQRLLYFVRR